MAERIRRKQHQHRRCLMDVVVSVRHFELNDEIKQHVIDTVNAAFGEFRLKISSVNVVLDMQRNIVKASISLGIKDYPVSAEGEGIDNVYKAIDEAVTKAENQARRYLEKKQAHRAVGLSAAESKKAEDDSK